MESIAEKVRALEEEMNVQEKTLAETEIRLEEHKKNRSTCVDKRHALEDALRRQETKNRSSRIYKEL